MYLPLLTHFRDVISYYDDTKSSDSQKSGRTSIQCTTLLTHSTAIFIYRISCVSLPR